MLKILLVPFKSSIAVYSYVHIGKHSHWAMFIEKVGLTTRKMPFSDEEFLTDPKNPLKKSYFRWQNKAFANTW